MMIFISGKKYILLLICFLSFGISCSFAVNENDSSSKNDVHTAHFLRPIEKITPELEKSHTKEELDCDNKRRSQQRIKKNDTWWEKTKRKIKEHKNKFIASGTFATIGLLTYLFFSKANVQHVSNNPKNKEFDICEVFGIPDECEDLPSELQFEISKKIMINGDFLSTLNPIILSPTHSFDNCEQLLGLSSYDDEIWYIVSITKDNTCEIHDPLTGECLFTKQFQKDFKKTCYRIDAKSKLIAIRDPINDKKDQIDIYSFDNASFDNKRVATISGEKDICDFFFISSKIQIVTSYLAGDANKKIFNVWNTKGKFLYSLPDIFDNKSNFGECTEAKKCPLDIECGKFNTHLKIKTKNSIILRTPLKKRDAVSCIDFCGTPEYVLHERKWGITDNCDSIFFTIGRKAYTFTLLQKHMNLWYTARELLILILLNSLSSRKEPCNNATCTISAKELLETIQTYDPGIRKYLTYLLFKAIDNQNPINL